VLSEHLLALKHHKPCSRLYIYCEAANDGNYIFVKIPQTHQVDLMSAHYS